MSTTDVVCGPLNCRPAGKMLGLKDAGRNRKLPKALGVLASARFLFSLLVKTWYGMACVKMPWRKSLALPAVPSSPDKKGIRDIKFVRSNSKTLMWRGVFLLGLVQAGVTAGLNIAGLAASRYVACLCYIGVRSNPH